MILNGEYAWQAFELIVLILSLIAHFDIKLITFENNFPVAPLAELNAILDLPDQHSLPINPLNEPLTLLL